MTLDHQAHELARFCAGLAVGFIAYSGAVAGMTWALVQVVG